MNGINGKLHYRFIYPKVKSAVYYDGDDDDVATSTTIDYQSNILIIQPMAPSFKLSHWS